MARVLAARIVQVFYTSTLNKDSISVRRAYYYKLVWRNTSIIYTNVTTRQNKGVKLVVRQRLGLYSVSIVMELFRIRRTYQKTTSYRTISNAKQELGCIVYNNYITSNGRSVTILILDTSVRSNIQDKLIISVSGHVNLVRKLILRDISMYDNLGSCPRIRCAYRR